MQSSREASVFDSEKSYCEKIIEEAQKGLDSNSDKYIQNLQSLIDNLEKWVEDNKPQFSLAEIIESWGQSLFAYGKTLKIPLCDGNDPELNTLFFNQWFDYFKSPDVEAMDLDALNALLEDRKKTATAIINGVKLLEENLESLLEILSRISFETDIPFSVG